MGDISLLICFENSQFVSEFFWLFWPFFFKKCIYLNFFVYHISCLCFLNCTFSKIPPPPPTHFFWEPSVQIFFCQLNVKKLAKARKTRKSPATLGLKNIGLGKLWVEKVWAQNIVINFLAELDHIKKINYCFFYFFLPFPPGPISGNPTHT